MWLRIVLVLAWSSGFIGAALGTAHAAADTFLALRYFVAAPVLVVAVLVLGRRLTRALVVRQAVVGLLCQCAYLGGVVYGVGFGVSAGTAALIAALQPLVVATAAAPRHSERATRLQWLGLVLGLAGVALVVSGDVATGQAPGWAYFLPVAGMLGLAGGSLLERRWDSGDDLTASLAVQTVVAAVVFAVLAAANDRLTVPTVPGFWVAVLWVVVLSTFGGYGAYLAVLRREGATRVSTLLYLTPPTTTLWAWVMLGDQPALLALPGGLVCLVAVVLVLREPRSGPDRLPEPASRALSTPGRGAVPRTPCRESCGDQQSSGC